MDKAIFMAVNSIKADKIKQINAVHEVANVSTVGFKKAFDLTVETFRVDLPGSFTSRFLLTPEELGVVDLTPGSRMATEQPLDIFIEGDGVLGVFNDEGEIAFTRRGLISKKNILNVIILKDYILISIHAKYMKHYPLVLIPLIQKIKVKK